MNLAVVFTFIALIYFVIALVTISAPVFVGGTTVIGMLVLAALLARYFEEARVSYINGATFQWEQLAIAIWGIFAGLMLQSGWNVFWRSIGMPSWGPDSLINSFVRFALLFFLILYLHATRKDKEPPARVWWSITGIGAVVALVIGWVLSAHNVGE